MNHRVAVLGALLAGGCDLAYPEIIIRSALPPSMLIRDPSFSGCRWSTVLATGESTSPQRCLPGADRVHLKRLEVDAYWRERRDDPAVRMACEADGGWTAVSEAGLVPGSNAVPLWFNYQTITVHDASYHQVLHIDLRADDLEQDFSIPGPFGH